MAKVIRVICYEGGEKELQEILGKSLPLGVRTLPGYTITIGQHYSDLPEAIELADEEVAKALEEH